MKTALQSGRLGWWLLLASLLAVIVIYAPGLRGGYLFDDYPNIVDNRGVQPADASIPSLVRAALSSPSSEFKRPLASLTFAINYLISGLDPFSMKMTNLVIHLFNGILVFLLARLTLRVVRERRGEPKENTFSADNVLAALIGAGWMLLPINLTAVLYVVQRMESLANVFVLLGLLGYLTGRERMLQASDTGNRAAILSALSLLLCTGTGLLAKETAIMLPLYAATAEWVLFGFRRSDGRLDGRIIAFYLITLVLPLIAGLAWLLPGLLQPGAWSTRDFTLQTRLLSEARIVCDYIAWTLVPTPHALSFYHDDFLVSQSVFSPASTLACIVALCALILVACLLRRRMPLVSLGLLWFLGAHLLTATILPLELVYEHRNYFASFGLLLALIPALATIPKSLAPLVLPGKVLVAGLLVLWAGQTLMTALAWSSPLSLAEELAARGPTSPRAQYELGRTYVILSNYDPSSPFTRLAYAPLERSAALPKSSILAEQALIFMNSRMHLPLKDAWWQSMIGKLKAHRPGVQDESSLDALTQCQQEGKCDLSLPHLTAAYLAALTHDYPSARLLAMYSNYAWNALGEHELGLRMINEAIAAAPHESAYRVTRVRMLFALGRNAEANIGIGELETQNIGGSLNDSITRLQALNSNH
ncbi:hypothetical protein [Dyella sp. ASV21]|uniref:hypothetical protein n=1 Tax=Dyella sp. ASV21 TaxID=2795114 RepID=UPI0018EBEA15|nr:hypothetical protein [Dyella sp. ASV21]